LTYYKEFKYASEEYWKLNEYILSQIPITYSVIARREQIMSKQSELIGEHPKSGLFFDWCKHEDIPTTTTKKHRKLTNKGIDRDILIDELSSFILKHHISPLKVQQFEKKKSILNKHEFNTYVDRRMPFPVQNFTTQKGNLGEIILAEYLEASSKLEVVIFKLHFNPNIEQAMKGDDILLFDKQNISNKMIMGEAKYRGTPTKQVVMDVINSLSKDNLPISLTFVSDRLMELGEIDLSEEIDDLVDKVATDSIDIIYVGFIHSNEKVSVPIEAHLHNSDNENLVILSYGEENPNDLIEKSFLKAIDKMRS